MEHVNVRELFAAFNSFGMQSLRSKNIDGRFSANINLSSMLDANNNLYHPANKGYVDFLLEDGRWHGTFNRSWTLITIFFRKGI